MSGNFQNYSEEMNLWKNISGICRTYIVLVMMEENNIQEIKKKADSFESQYTNLKQEFKDYIESSRKNEAKIQQEIKKDFVKRLLVVADSFDRISKQNNDAHCDVVRKYSENIKENVDVIYNQLLSAAALTPIDPEAGDEFDANKHMAVGLEYSIVYPENSVIRTVRKGYSSENNVVRPCEIIVSKRPIGVNIMKLGSWNRFLRWINPSKYLLKELNENIIELEGLQKENIEKLTRDLNSLSNSLIGLEEKIVSIEQNVLQQDNANVNIDQCQVNKSYETHNNNSSVREIDDVE
ncbi:MAG: nucleotide exchange factor GrpE [Methanosarcinales archaeon]|nr:nucleotide exchange factor GrpE [Methanosarcinales archaeon]